MIVTGRHVTERYFGGTDRVQVPWFTYIRVTAKAQTIQGTSRWNCTWVGIQVNRDASVPSAGEVECRRQAREEITDSSFDFLAELTKMLLEIFEPLESFLFLFLRL